ncbi:uncharacterized protein LOC114539636 [Dendronephthya gigantea]|uniref:uncharacterized protein LOC114539636 n=1 Tax=Dendronephthya gigantea TaxID=151771 RepID=UPI00106907D4|nr:uncharacterized protein LOC114539636 [Dendronephthya gigantea]
MILYCLVLSSAINAMVHRPYFPRKENTVNARQIAAQKCNGLPDLCELRIDQVTFAGSHNAGSGFDGRLHWWSGGAAPSCFIRNHGKSFSEQLDYGIRYFDIETCFGETEALNCHCGKNVCAYAGSIEEGLKQIDSWMQSHPSEVAIIHFNSNVQKGYEKNISRSIESTLMKLWPPNNSGKLAMSGYYMTHGNWPKLKDAIRPNERILIFVAYELYQYMSLQHKWLVLSFGQIVSTRDTNPVTSSCSGITEQAKEKCGIPGSFYTFIEVSAFGSYGKCIWDMAETCSSWLGEAAFECYNLRERRDLTVNFLLVDWVDYFAGGESVINKAKFMNQKNIQMYLGKSIFFPELSGCAYHSSSHSNYCWKYCAKYGWCWINVKCGEDPDVCKKQDYRCYSSCGY